MHQNLSPWLAQLKITRPIDIIGSNLESDIVVVGAGIAGVMTSYYILKNTDKNLILLEGSKVAHGATGHNAGQIVADFEKSLSDLASEFGITKAVEAERDARSAWTLLDEIYQDTPLQTPISSFVGYNGYIEKEHILEEIKNNALRRGAGLQIYPIYVSDKIDWQSFVPGDFRELYEIVPHQNIFSLLETTDSRFIGAVALRKGCANSAMLSEEIVGYLLNTYKGRFSLFEHSGVKKIHLEKDHALIEVSTNRKDNTPEENYTVATKRVILCTNGFERLHIINNAGEDINKEFHQMVNGDIGYMTAYVEEMKAPPTALGYYDVEGYKKDGNAYTEDPYFYVTRRPFELENNQTHNLISVGGPEKQVAETQDYDRQGAFSQEMGDKIDTFVKTTLRDGKSGDLEYKFQWHGMMCYTPTNMRVIGFEPKNPVLMYNIGCNGVGILTSIFGGYKISKLLNGETFPPSIFDPRG